MMNFIKNDIVRLITGETCRVLNIPGTFMSNGAYEVVEVKQTPEGSYKDTKNKKWVKPKQIAYGLNQDDGTNNIVDYFEIVQDEEIQMIPKNLTDVELVEENGFKTMKLIYEKKIINILIGDFNPIKNKENGFK